MAWGRRTVRLVTRMGAGVWLVLAATRPAAADVVTECAADTQGGPGAANLQRALAAAGPITFQCPAGSVIVLSSAYLVTRATVIDGGGRVTLDGGDHIMFRVQSGASLRFVDLGIRNADGRHDVHGGPLPLVRGGVVDGDGHVELLRTTVTDSDDAFILSAGSIRIRASRLAGNRGTSVQAPVIDIAQGTRLSDNTGTPVRAISGTVTITDTEFLGNATSTFVNCTLAIDRSTFTANVGAAEGGALRVDCPATIEKSTFANNRARSGGALYIQARATQVELRRVRFMGNVAQETGGAIDVERTAAPLRLTIRSSMFEDNRARQGGALNLARFLSSTRTLEGGGVTFARNTAVQKGGAIFAFNAGVSLARGAFVANEAAMGGAVYAQQQGRLSAEFANSLFAANRASQGGSAFHGAGVTFIATTIAANEGVAVVAEDSPLLPGGGSQLAKFPIRFASTIVHGAVAPCGPAVPRAAYEDLGHSIQYPTASCGGTMPAVYPGLGPMFAPMPWSPALNAGDAARCQTAPVNGRDLYGVTRPLMEACSIGAVEGDLPRLVSRWVRHNPELRALVRSALGLVTPTRAHR